MTNRLMLEVKLPYRSRRIWIRGMLSLFAALSAISIGVVPALAQCDPVCEAGQLCFWSGVNESNGAPEGSFSFWSSPGSGFDDDGTYANNKYEYIRTETEMDNTITSVWNRSNKMLVLYELPNCKGAFFCIGPNKPNSYNLKTGDGGFWNNKFSSHKLFTDPPPQNIANACNLKQNPGIPAPDCTD